MAFNPLALLGGLQGFTSKNEETSNKINAMKQQGFELQDMLKQRKRTQDRENVVQTQQDDMYNLQKSGMLRAEDIAKILHSFALQAAPAQGQAMLGQATLNQGLIGQQIKNQPRLFKLDDADLTQQETVQPLRHQFQVGDAKHALQTQATRQGLDVGTLSQQGVELKNAWMRPYRANYYKAQAAFDAGMEQASNKALPYAEQMKAFMAAQQAKNLGQSMLQDAAAEARAQGITDNSWQLFFQQGQEGGPQFKGSSFKGPMVPPVGLFTDPSVLGLFDTVTGGGNAAFNPSTDLTIKFPTLDKNTKTLKDGSVTANRKQNERWLNSGFMTQFKAFATSTGNHDVGQALMGYTGLKNIVEGKHFIGESIPPTIVKDGRLIPNPLHDALMQKSSSLPMSKEQVDAIKDATTLMESRVGHLVGMLNASTMDEASKRQETAAAYALAEKGFSAFAGAMQGTLNTLNTRVNELIKRANITPTFLQSLNINNALTAYDNNKKDIKNQATVAYITMQKVKKAYLQAAANPGKPTMLNVIKEMDTTLFQELFPDVSVPSGASDRDAPPAGGTNEPPALTGNAGNTGQSGNFRLRPLNPNQP